MKLKTYTHKTIEEDTKVELPVYFYIQGGDAFQEDYIKIDKNGKTIIKRSYHKLVIEYIATDTSIDAHYINRYETTKENYQEAFNYALKQLKK